MRRMVWSVIAAVTSLAFAVPASAQLASSPARFGIVGGGTFPIGNLSDVSSSGWHAGALVDLGLPLVPLGFRVEGTWHQLGSKDTPDRISPSEKARVIAVTLNATYAFGPQPLIKPYIIGGVGGYNVEYEPSGLHSFSETRFGINLGAGLRVQLTGFSTFAEIRWHDIFTTGNSVQMLPISVGVTF
ncbi:MAG TPA: porin family protein [Gemmatimonadaceae bacterium]